MESNDSLLNDTYRVIAESMSDLVCLHDLDGRYLWVSPSCERILGYFPDELLGKNPYDLFHPDDQERIRNETHAPARDGIGNIYVRYRIQRADGDYIWLETLTQPIANDDGEVVYLHTTSRDVSQQVKVQQELDQSESLNRAIFESVAEAIIVFSKEGRILTFNHQTPVVLKADPGLILGESARSDEWSAIHLDGSPFPLEEQPIFVTLSTGQDLDNVYMGIQHRYSSDLIWLSVNSRSVRDETDKHNAAAVLSIRDISESVNQGLLLKQWSLMFEHSSEPMLIIDQTGMVHQSNPAFNRLVIGSEEAEVNTNWHWFIERGTNTNDSSQDVINQASETGLWRGELWLRDQIGQLQVAWVSVSKTPVAPGGGHLYVCIFSNFEEKYQETEALHFQATHDPLTGLPNRLLLHDRFDMGLKSSLRYQELLGCVYIDLDNFKPINDQYGHSVGDQVLKIFSENLKSCIRGDDTLARLGGDEFVAVITALDSFESLEQVVEKLMESSNQAVVVDNHSFLLSASMGVSVYPDDGRDTTSLIAVADDAMYRAKKSGGGTWRKGKSAADTNAG